LSTKEKTMEVLVSRGCGLDVHQATVVACLLIGEPGGLPGKQVKTFSTMTSALIELRDWLQSEGCTAVAREATGVYWKPVYNLLEGHFELIVANARHIKAVPGRKTDVKDAEWIADLLRHGLLQPSYVPPPELRELRSLLRYRVKLVNARSAERNRISKLLESANIKLSSVVSDLFGVSGRLMLDALKRGAATPEEMAELAKRRHRSKPPELKLALDGRFEAHHRQLLSIQLDRLEGFDRDLKQMDAKLEVKLKPYARRMELLDGVPGIDWVVAATVIAEMGIKMSQWPTVGHLSSWAGLCPGQNQSAGKRGKSKIRPGNPYLRSALVEAALAVTREKDCYFREKYYRLKARRGHKRAVVAVAHKILIAIYYVLSSDTCAYRKSHPTFRRLHLQDLHPDTTHRLSNLDFPISLLVYGSLPSSLF